MAFLPLTTPRLPLPTLSTGDDRSKAVRGWEGRGGGGADGFTPSPLRAPAMSRLILLLTAKSTAHSHYCPLDGQRDGGMNEGREEGASPQNFVPTVRWEGVFNSRHEANFFAGMSLWPLDL